MIHMLLTLMPDLDQANLICSCCQGKCTVTEHRGKQINPVRTQDWQKYIIFSITADLDLVL